MARVSFRQQSQNEFSRTFMELQERHSGWQIWSDFIQLSAIAIDAPFGNARDEKRREREKLYLQIIGNYSEREKSGFSKLFEIMADALEENPEQDFLGEMFMVLELSSHWKGQFFTPYSICRLMAEMQLTDAEERIREKGWIGICDPSCGAGALLVAARNYLNNERIGYLPGHLHTLFVCQDIDPTAALMCYIQLSLLGCAGYVTIGDSLCNPGVSHFGNPLLPIEKEGQDIWCMPMFHDPVWVQRQAIAKLGAAPLLKGRAETSALPVPEHHAAAKKESKPKMPRPKPLQKPEKIRWNDSESGQLTFF